MIAVLIVGSLTFLVLGGPQAAVSLAQGPRATPTLVVSPPPRPTASPTRAPDPTATALPSPTPTMTPQPTATPTPVPWTVATLEIPAGKVSTVQVTVAEGGVLEGSFTVDREVAFSVLDPAGQTLYNPGRVRERSNFSVRAGNGGPYMLRFDNRFSVITGKSVRLQYRVRPVGA